MTNKNDYLNKKELLNEAAEKFAHLFWQQILWMNEEIKKAKNKKSSKNNNQ